SNDYSHMSSPTRASISSLFSFPSIIPGSDKLPMSPPRFSHTSSSSSLFDKPIDVLLSPERNTNQRDRSQEVRTSKDKVSSSVPDERDNTMLFSHSSNGTARHHPSGIARSNSFDAPIIWSQQKNFHQQPEMSQTRI